MNSLPVISAYPDARLMKVVRCQGAFSSELGRFTSLHTSGRAALYHAFRAIRTISDAPAWIPAYHCGVEVQAALDAGLKVNFYPVESSLGIRFSSFMRLWDRDPGHLLVVHYFGFGQTRLDRFAEELAGRRFLLIEDCAHALFSSPGGRPLGENAAVSIFSLRKTLPLFHGGGVRLQPRAWADAGYGLPAVPALLPSSRAALLQAAKQQAIRLVGARGVSLLRIFRGKPAFDAGTLSPPNLNADPLRDEEISPLCRRLVASTDPPTVVETRRRNYLLLHRELDQHPGYNPVFRSLPDGVCPLCLPVMISGREKFLRAMWEAKVVPFVFGAYAHPLLPEALQRSHRPLRDAIVGLPIHQQLSITDIQRIARAVAKLLDDHAVDQRTLQAQLAF
jgi:dTDP-4-amino-4,6-dideoxygalactose transaminase